jgi:hypothetical protein
VLSERIATRRSAGSDASEADLAVLRWQMQHFDGIDDDELPVTSIVHTDQPAVMDQAMRALESFSAHGRPELRAMRLEQPGPHHGRAPMALEPPRTS